MLPGVKNDHENVPKISILTVCLNSSNTIRETIESVLGQNYPNVEYIIVDGASTDGTLEIIESYRSRISNFISESDEGLYYAMNKGIDLCSGDVVGILNSDDVYANEDILSEVMEIFRIKKTDCIYGDLYYFGKDELKKPLRYFKGKIFRRDKMKMGLAPPHPTFFVTREIYLRYGKFDVEFKLAADFDLMLRFLYVHNIRCAYIPKTIVKMRLGGKSTKSLLRLWAINKEDMRSCKKHGVKTNFLIFHLKYLYKISGVKSWLGLFNNAYKQLEA